jgi:hypothetical protein
MARTGDGVVVLVGPSLPAAEAARLLPGAELHGPAAAGDILRLVVRHRRPRAIALIDGLFERMAAPWHKELLLALERGVAVYGAASMGALRAAELAPHGVRGVGAVYRLYASGEVTSDAEVAVAHAPAEFGYRAATVAQVNVRLALAKLVRRGVLSPASARRVRDASAAVFYRDRDLAAVLAAVADARLSSKELGAITRAWRRGLPDHKAADARVLLRTLRRPFVPPATVRCERTWALRTFADQLGLTLPP